MDNPELLSPAGTLRNMKYAFAYGADAVYAGQPRYSLRVRNNDFDSKTLAQGISYAHNLGKKFYLASNILPHNSKLKTYIKDLTPIIEMGPDALIMSDPGLIYLVKDAFPHMPIHLSVQANTMNWAAVKFWYQAGIERIILSRELSLDEIAEIKQRCPEMEIEVFVHGALCIAYSGRCLLSGYINKRDSNQGACTNTCRWKYHAHEATQNDSGDIVPVQHYDAKPALGEGTPTNQIFLLQEETRPGEYMPAFEDEHGTYIMNSKDLRAIQHVHRLIKMGVNSLKIEGRTKSHYYASRTAQTYRQAIDDAIDGKPFDMSLMDELENLASRGYTEGFYRRHIHDEYQNYEQGNSVGVQQQFVGEITEYDKRRAMLQINVKNRFEVGDTLEFMSPQGNSKFVLNTLLDRNGNRIDVAPGSGYQVQIAMSIEQAEGIDFTYAMLMRDLPNKK
ncbi:MAG: putative protease [Osedax symbiont Rs1]|nr:MAG: putative protease [Osedax symbiont Rs1]